MALAQGIQARDCERPEAACTGFVQYIADVFDECDISCYNTVNTGEGMAKLGDFALMERACTRRSVNV
jgi:hypothetical protein